MWYVIHALTFNFSHNVLDRYGKQTVAHFRIDIPLQSCKMTEIGYTLAAVWKDPIGPTLK